MKKKLFLLIAMLCCGLLLLAGCGDSGESEEEPITDSGNGESEIAFGLDETVEYEGLCEMSGLYAEVLDDNAKEAGWSYFYTDNSKSPAEVKDWVPSDGNYTTVEVLFTVKNTSDEPQTFSDKINAQMFYQENPDADTDYFDGTVFQTNPGQTDEDGNEMICSTDPVEIAPGETTQVTFRFDIPKEVYEQVYETAAGESTGIIETCEFNFGDGTTYIINLVSTMVLPE